MSYNLLIDTNFNNNMWNFNNCYYKNGYLVSTSKIFGIYQELVLPDITKLYFRCSYIANNLSKNCSNIKIGIQNGDVLSINTSSIRVGKEKSISLVENAKQEKIKVHIIFESSEDYNEILIKEPLLYDLNHFNKSTWLKLILDKTIKFREGYCYKNILDFRELKIDNELFKDEGFIDGKIGLINCSKQNKEIEIQAKFIENNYYLAKLDFNEINKFGSSFLQYGNKHSEQLDDEQAFIIFKYKRDIHLKLVIESNDREFNYCINLKNLMVIDITKLKLLKEDIPYLPFI